MYTLTDIQMAVTVIKGPCMHTIAIGHRKRKKTGQEALPILKASNKFKTVIVTSIKSRITITRV